MVSFHKETDSNGDTYEGEWEDGGAAATSRKRPLEEVEEVDGAIGAGDGACQPMDTDDAQSSIPISASTLMLRQLVQEEMVTFMSNLESTSQKVRTWCEHALAARPLQPSTAIAPAEGQAGSSSTALVVHGETQLEQLRTENEELKAWKQKRMSIEASLPALPEGRAYTVADTYVLLSSDETLRDLVGEQYGKLHPSETLRVTHEDLLVVHDPEAGFAFKCPLMQQIITRLLTKVRSAVRGVDAEELEEVDGLDQSMVSRLGKLSDAASKVDEPKLKQTLVTHLQATPASVLTLDAQPGILNLRGPKVAVYDRKTAPKLVGRDPALHHVHRTTGVDGAWLEETLPPDKQAQYDRFETEQLRRWFVNGEVCSYFLCATGDALFGGDTTRIKSSLLLIGDPDQAKSSTLDTAAAAGGWEKPGAGRKKNVSTSHAYAFGGADPNALLAKSSKDTLRNAMLKAVDGSRLVKFNELEATDVWRGVKGLSNKEEQSITKKRQSSGDTTIDLIETPYALLSTNKPPPQPPEDVKTKVAVVTPAMLGRFVDGDGDGVATFPKVPDLDCSTFPGPMLRAMFLALKAHYEAHPSEPFDHEKHLPECMREARDDPATWASGSGGAGTSGAIKSAVEATISPEDKATVVEELQKLLKPDEGSVVTLRTKEPSLVCKLSDSSLLLLGAEDVEQAKDPSVKEYRVKWLPTFLANLRACLVGPDSAFPDFKIEENTTGNSAGVTKGRRFTGEYVKGLAFVQA